MVSKIFLCLFLAAIGTILAQAVAESFCNHTTSTQNHTKAKDVLGVCVNFPEGLQYCPKFLSYLESGNQNSEWEILLENFCSSTIPNGKICCPLNGDGSYVEDITHNPEPDYTQHRNWRIFQPMLKQMKCGVGVGIGDRIVGGQDVELGHFPWMVRIGYALFDNSTLFTCSGTIITDRYILTSAHCLNYWTQHGLELAPIRLADVNDRVDPEIGPYGDKIHFQDIPIKTVHVHLGYNPKILGSHHDIALIRLQSPIPNLRQNLYMRAICLPFVKEYGLKNGGLELDEVFLVKKKFSPLYRGIISGWGKISNTNNTSSSILQCLRVPIQPSILCRILYASTNFSSNQICVGGDLNKNSCWGDSGGPLMVVVTSSGQLFQTGIISYGSTDCGKEGVPAVYTRVRDYLGWILDTVQE